MMLDGGASDTSSVTLDHDPDPRYFEREKSQTVALSSSLQPLDIIDLTDNDDGFDEGDYIADEDFEALLEGWMASAQAANPPSLPEGPERTQLDEICDSTGIVYKPGQSVELHDDTFLQICSIWDKDGEISFQGRRLWRLKDRHGTYLPSWKNELIWVVYETRDIPLGLIKRFVLVHFTNYSHTQDPHRIDRPRELFCRLKETIQRNNTSVETSIEYLTYAEADVEFRVRASILRSLWRGETAAFGSEEKFKSPIVVLDPIEDQSIVNEHKVQRKYTFGDAFCGAGGVSCGAEAAGLHIKWAFDLSPHAGATYRLNFPTVLFDESDIFHFLVNDEEFLRIDITHGSPPCQTWSPAHTSAGPNDDANSACIFACGDLIRKAKPRVHTMEETSGLIERHQEVFFGVVHDFLEIGYSVRWAVLKCREYGVPQTRKRLVIIASGPGETLPSLPQPTHGPPGSGLSEEATIYQAISNIPLGTSEHDVEASLARAKGLRPPYDANQQARTITCGGGENNYHPSGMRNFTNREYACLQTFPLSFQFGPREVRTQIGNAVPPLLAKAVYGEIIKSLQESDERELREDP
ncbi:S-adenosyl-L-methionine-dependent methyltransferase [Aspergillus unguis]